LTLSSKKDIKAGLRQGYPREEFVKRLHCVYGTSGGGVWMYPPHRWDRSSWFLPYTKRIGNATKEDYDAGARGSLYYLGPVSEFYMDELFGNSPGPAGYLEDLYLGGPDGRLAYKKGLASILKILPEIENDFNDHGRVEKIKRSIIFTLMLVNTFSQGRNELKVYRTGPL
jgi:hypothetical protein